MDYPTDTEKLHFGDGWSVIGGRKCESRDAALEKRWKAVEKKMQEEKHEEEKLMLELATFKVRWTPVLQECTNTTKGFSSYECCRKIDPLCPVAVKWHQTAVHAPTHET